MLRLPKWHRLSCRHLGAQAFMGFGNILWATSICRCGALTVTFSLSPNDLPSCNRWLQIKMVPSERLPLAPGPPPRRWRNEAFWVVFLCYDLGDGLSCRWVIRLLPLIRGVYFPLPWIWAGLWLTLTSTVKQKWCCVCAPGLTLKRSGSFCLILLEPAAML